MGRSSAATWSSRADHESVTVSGRACAPLDQHALSEEDRRRAYYYSAMPNLLLSIHPDYVNYYMLTPLAVDRTRVESEWLFNLIRPARRPFRPDEAVSFWDSSIARTGTSWSRANRA